MTGPEPAAIPPQAITDVAEALRKAGWQGSPESMAIIILFAAKPHLAAAERERCAQLAETEAAKVSDVGLANAFRNLAALLREQP